MPIILLLLLIAVGFVFLVKHIAVVTTIVAIIVGGISVIALVSTWLGTSYSLHKSGYHPRRAKQAYSQLQSDLEGIRTDLTDLRLQLDELTPSLRDIEYLKYARANKKQD